MAQIQLTKAEIDAVENKLKTQKGKLPPDEAQMLEMILKKAKGEMRSLQADPEWVFNVWTFHF